MRTIDIVMEDTSFADLDAVSRAAGLSPSEFIKRAAAAAVKLHKARNASARDLAGYAEKPVEDDEFKIDPADLDGMNDETW